MAAACAQTLASLIVNIFNPGLPAAARVFQPDTACPVTQYAMSQTEDIHRRIIELEVEHRDLDAVIEALIHDLRHEELQLRRLKKRKLQLKDHITMLRMQLIPDIPA